jgi:hypothetical protein
MSAAQRLVLAAAMARRAAEEFRGAEQDALTDDVSGLPAPVPERIAAALATAEKGASGAAGSPGYVDEAQRVFNQLLAALPIMRPHPVFYGLLSRDLSAEPLASDIVIYGYRLVDPVYRTPPVVRYNKIEVPSTVEDDNRIDASLPDEVKKAINFAPPPCESRASFGLRVSETYAQRKGLWPVVWHTQVLSNTDLYALPTPVIYAARATVTTQATAAAVSTVAFQQKSELATADCQQTRTVAVDVPLPPGAKNVTCSGEWVDASGAAKITSRCAPQDGTLHVTGELTGGARVCSPDNLCICASSAQGFLEAKGSYQVEAAEREVKTAEEPSPLVFPAGGAAQASLAIPEGHKLRHVALAVSRRACPAMVDSIDVNIGDDPEGRGEGISKTGAFRAEIAGGKLKIGAADAFAADPAKTP